MEKEKKVVCYIVIDNHNTDLWKGIIISIFTEMFLKFTYQ
jgi:hypothetical protein